VLSLSSAAVGRGFGKRIINIPLVKTNGNSYAADKFLCLFLFAYNFDLMFRYNAIRHGAYNFKIFNRFHPQIPPVVRHSPQINTDWYCLAAINDHGKAVTGILQLF
jgi:hypothetical protein